MRKKQKQRKKEVDLLILILDIFILIFLISILFYGFNETLLKKEFLIKLNIGNHTGFDVNETALSFGTISINSNSKRKILLENNYKFPIKFEFYVKGNVSKLLIFKKSIKLDPGKNVSFTIKTIYPDNSSQYGSYSGVLVSNVKRSF